MTFTRAQRLTVFFEPEEGRRLRVGQLATKDRAILFEYDAAFLATRLELSPVKLPLRPGVVVGDPAVFGGLMGVFEDSLPDGWGRLLMDRQAAKAGFSPAQMGPLDRLTWVGSRAVGALVYEPEVKVEFPTVLNLAEVADDVEAVLSDTGAFALDRLIALGGSPQGARPKALVQVADDGRVIYGDRQSRPNCSHYLVKFLAPQDDKQAGALECCYMQMAAAAGIDVPPILMLGRTRKHPGYFAVKRFDRDGRRKHHTHTLAGLLHAPHFFSAITYQDLLLATRTLTRNEDAVSEQFRRACFNVFAHNRDDHTRNFSFIMNAAGEWRPSPVYDLTFSEGPGGEHSMLVGREGANPTDKDLMTLARTTGVKHANAIIEQVRQTICEFYRYADAAGLRASLKNRVGRLLGAKVHRRRAQKRGRPTH